MVFDTLENMEMYIPLFDKLRTIIDAMDHDDVYSLARGKYKTPDPEVTYEVVTYATSSSDLPFEFHKKTTIVQIVLEGSELVSTTWRELKDQARVFDEKTDTGYFVSEPISAFTACKGRFSVFFPGEPFKSGVACGEPENIKKVIFRVKE